MSIITAVLTLIVEVFRLIEQRGGVKPALETLQSINGTMDILNNAKTESEEQDAAKAISDALKSQ